MNIGPVFTKFVNNPKVIKFASDPTWPVAGLIISNAAFRPLFTLADPNVKPAAKKYSAAREFFHQCLCMVSLFALSEKFKQFGFWAGKKALKNVDEFKNFNNYKEVQGFIKKGGNLLKKYPTINGSIIVGSMLGAIIALAIIAPKLNNWLLPPLLNKLGIKLKEEEEYKKVPGIYAKSLNNGMLQRNLTASQIQSFNQKV